ncbi:unnamed protein product [Cyprideis torosa]|uniref:Uncharacterized protein n=1 Tax=Cyprideis torosa TaxID=163714 RepID=A0A7R8ZKU6_9CRUS|nr:unnamed protein product [Cyprideis torosa]CAG0891929.1 unnamed protein product [Cyprideis torosa]
MVAATATVVAIAATAGAAAPAAAAGIQAGLAMGTGGSIATATGVTAASTAATVGTTAALGGTAGAMAGAGATAGAGLATAAGAGVGAASGAGAGTAMTAMTAGVLSGPVGWICLGASASNAAKYTFDCWKQVVHEEDPSPSKGRLLQEMFDDPRVIAVETICDEAGGVSHLVLENAWQERFRVDFYQLEDQIAGHATQL